MEVIHTETLRGYRIDIFQDSDPSNPRKEFDHAANMYCAHGRYTLGDSQFSTSEELEGEIVSEMHSSISSISDDTVKLDDLPIIWLPLYLYDHSGITMSTKKFTCPWDSGQVGVIWISREKAKSEWAGVEFETEEAWTVKVLEYLRNEVEEYDQYLTGQVYGFTITNGETDEELHSVWGFYGDYEAENGCLAEARVEVPLNPPEPVVASNAIIMVFHDDGTVEFTRSPKLYKFFDGEGSMVRISEINKFEDSSSFHIKWLKGPYAGYAHLYKFSLELGLVHGVANDGQHMTFSTYELAVEHEVKVLNALRRRGVSFV